MQFTTTSTTPVLLKYSNISLPLEVTAAVYLWRMYTNTHVTVLKNGQPIHYLVPQEGEMTPFAGAIALGQGDSAEIQYQSPDGSARVLNVEFVTVMEV